MNHSCEMWNRPWHALQKNLAAGIDGHFGESCASVLEVVNVRWAGMGKERNCTMFANSWLSRIQLRTPAVPARQ